MNSKNRQLRLIMLALMLIPFIGVYAQVNEITLSKPGKLGKELGKSADTITTLKVNGGINGKDIILMISMPKLISLDLKNAEIVEAYSYRSAGTSQKKEYDKGTLLISGSRHFEKLSPPRNCYKIVILPPNESDDTFHLPYFRIGTLVVDSDIAINSSKTIVVDVLDNSRWEEDYWNQDWNMKNTIKSINPCFIKSKQKNYSIWNWSRNIDDLLATCNKYHISKFQQVLPNSFSSVKCGDTLDLSRVFIRILPENAFRGCPVKHLVLSSSIEEFYNNTFDDSSIETVEFTGKQPPKCKYTASNKIGNITMIVPDGYFMYYSQYYGWKDLSVREKNGITEYEFTIEKPGTLGNYLTYEITKSVERLTLKGAIYDTDVKYINECNNLTYLDLTYCYVAKSPQTIEKEKATREFQAAVFQMLGEMTQENAHNQFEQGNISYAEAMDNVVWGEYAKQAAELLKQDKVKATENCICPELKLQKLKEYHMPIQAKVIYARACSSLEKVVLPPKATAVEYYGFAHCEKLKEISFPNTLLRIGGGAFYGCKSLEVLNFSKSQLVEIVESRDGTFEGCENLKAVAFPATFQRMTESTWKSPMCHWYFLSKEKPQYVRVPDGIVHIPKGSINGWRALANDQHIRLVDDIEIVDK